MSDHNYALEKVGRSAAESICEMVAALECDYDRLEYLTDAGALCADKATELRELKEAAGECTSREDAEQRIQEDALSVLVRTDWRNLDEMDNTPDEFCILLSTGGPASRIRGELLSCGPSRAWLEVQDWGTPWTRYHDISQDTLLAYARCFYFGEG